ncbi:YhbY family RNA-binding protein [Gammaproteobacteria bacterium]|nr:YhbY family RNA-binding protein [Gammaproteobacteria bacterium]
MDKKFLKKLISIGHNLSPIMRITKHELSTNVMQELDRALNDHELIKVKIVGEKEVRNNLFLQMEALPETKVIQKIGGVIVLYRPSKETNRKLSNILRAGKH